MPGPAWPWARAQCGRATSCISSTWARTLTGSRQSGAPSTPSESRTTWSRTDAGVHALSNAAHLDVQRRSGRPPFSPEVLTQALNTHLRHPAIRVLQAFRVPSHFHARHAATSRTYLYRLATGCPRPDQLPVFERNRCWALRADCLDVAAMREAAQHLLGTHDFRAFQSAGSPATSPVRTLRRASVSPDPASSPFVLPEESRRLRFWSLEFESQSFLYRQVRRMTSVLVAVGLGALMPAQVKAILESQDPLGRHQSRVAPAHGLFLKAVLYEGFESTARRSQVIPDTQQGQGGHGTLGPAAGRCPALYTTVRHTGTTAGPTPPVSLDLPQVPACQGGLPEVGCRRQAQAPESETPKQPVVVFTGNQHLGSPTPISWEPRSRHKR
ncbi:tRNA pseudouridine synthase-like 1 isoform X1 [Mesoplodon densirostris]|uniref:tRNA pseudouridine synthase-like 1 isoform X1 n=1 Tax=Mesoplodon densirostris TaxID=48708 RepID=UPI0028DB7CA7|nr:tRNA pseudouridine synthase-like 1 isoform X1 [Mesoplodon densirostris]